MSDVTTGSSPQATAAPPIQPGPVQPGPIQPGRRTFMGVAASSVLLAGFGGVAAGIGGDRMPGLIAPADAVAGPTPHHAITPPRFPTLSAPDRREWSIFRRRFIGDDGRVIDTGNNCVSHTEGQGWGMLFAVTFDDRPTFDRIYGWTQANLSRMGDALHSWCYDPSRPNPVSDPNNATDGDLFIAWALWKAAWRWNNPAYADQARLITRDVLNLLVVQAGTRTLLLPGADGFEHPESYDINLSYYCFPALHDLAQAVPSPHWDTLRRGGLELIEAGRFGRWMLPPDWLGVSRHDGTLQPAAGWPARFSFDAIRIPLYLHWAQQGSPEVRQAFISYWMQTAPLTPAWVDLRDGVTATYPSPPGMVAVAKLATRSTNNVSNRDFPSIHTSPDYYSSALILLSRLASYENET